MVALLTEILTSTTYRASASSMVRPNSQQPNEFDLKRIERALAERKRYRYVTPTVQATAEGYMITSPCCSRNIEPDGGVIDIARLDYLADSNGWRLYRKDHQAQLWIFHADFASLIPILALLREDPERRFWQ